MVDMGWVLTGVRRGVFWDQCCGQWWLDDRGSKRERDGIWERGKRGHVSPKGENMLQKYKRACLSKGGRLIMIPTVLSTIPTYYMSLFKIPNSFSNGIEKLMMDFLWEKVEKGKIDHLVNWEVVGKPKSFRGLGMSSLKTRNVALRPKWL